MSGSDANPSDDRHHDDDGPGGRDGSDRHQGPPPRQGRRPPQRRGQPRRGDSRPERGERRPRRGEDGTQERGGGDKQREGRHPRGQGRSPGGQGRAPSGEPRRRDGEPRGRDGGPRGQRDRPDGRDDGRSERRPRDGEHRRGRGRHPGIGADHGDAFGLPGGDGRRTSDRRDGGRGARDQRRSSDRRTPRRDDEHRPRRERYDDGPRTRRDGDRGPRRDDDRGSRPRSDEDRPRRGQYDGGGRRPRRDGERGPRSDDGRRPRRDGERGSRPRFDEDRPRRERPSGSRVRRGEADISWPEVPDWVEVSDIGRDVLADLRSLSKENSDFVAGHLLAATALVDDDPGVAWTHARAARSRGGRIAVVRETVGLIAYRAGEWSEALAELRAARRMAGGPGHVAVMADAERALGHPERAIEIAREADISQLEPEIAAELDIVAANARADMGQREVALISLRTAVDAADPSAAFTHRLYYAYAALLLDDGQRAEAASWFVRAANADVDDDTDAAARAAELAAQG